MNKRTQKSGRSGLKVSTSIKAGGITAQHNETLARGLKVRSSVRAGGITAQHNETLVSYVR